jgi:hypothetical protein
MYSWCVFCIAMEKIHEKEWNVAPWSEPCKKKGGILLYGIQSTYNLALYRSRDMVGAPCYQYTCPDYCPAVIWLDEGQNSWWLAHSKSTSFWKKWLCHDAWSALHHTDFAFSLYCGNWKEHMAQCKAFFCETIWLRLTH